MCPFTFFDLETTSLKPDSAAILQCAVVYTDDDLVIKEEKVFRGAFASDHLPSPIALSVTGLLPSTHQSDFPNERALSSAILSALDKEGHILVGYNSLRYDHHVLRFLFYRNGFYPYVLEGDGRRWDLLDPLRAAYGLRPSGLHFPKNESGETSLRLAELAPKNGIALEKAHDALFDTHATIGMAKALKNAQPRLFQHLFQSRTLASLQKQFGALEGVCLHVSGQYGAAQGYMAPVALFPSSRKNYWLAYDLRVDPERFSGLSTETLRERLFTRASEGEAEHRPPIKNINLKSSPIVLPISVLNHEESKGKWDIDVAEATANYQKLQKLSALRANFFVLLSGGFGSEEALTYPPDSTAASGLYGGDFFAHKTLIQHLCETYTDYEKGRAHLLSKEGVDTAYLLDFWVQYCFRNHRDTMDLEALSLMEARITDRLSGESGYYGLSWEDFELEMKSPEVQGLSQAAQTEIRTFCEHFRDTLGGISS